MVTRLRSDVAYWVELPQLNTLHHSEDESPLYVWGRTIAGHLNIDLEKNRIDLTSLYIDEDYYGSLREKCKQWFLAYYDIADDVESEYAVDKDLFWLFLDVGPAVFSKNHKPEWVEPEKGYYKLGALVK